MDSSSPTEHIDLLIAGAGLSGIDAAYRVQTGNPSLSYAVFEARDAIGGTWDLFRYPGIRSDSDMTTLGFPFRPWRGDQAIVDGADIRAYIEDTAAAFGIDRQIRFRHRITAADWSSADERWIVRYEVDGISREISCGFLFLCCGYYDYDQGHAPGWPGLETFAGRLVHPQFWPDDLDLADKKVIVIGSGATAVTLVPALVKRGAAAVTMLQRSPTYIVSRPARDEQGIRLRRWLPARLADTAIRWKNIALGTLIYSAARRRPDRVKQRIARAQRAALGPAFDMAHLTPRYEPWDQRLCLVPDGDLFTALHAGAASIVTDTIDHFTSSGIALASGSELPADIVVSATGLKLKLMGGVSLNVDGDPVEVGTRLVYRGAMLEGVPNLAFALGYTNASWTLKCDLTARLVGRIVRHMRRSGIGSVRAVASDREQSGEPLLGLKSGYVERAAGLLPRQGSKAPWRVHQNYPRDLLALWSTSMRDRALQFTRYSRAESSSR